MVRRTITGLQPVEFFTLGYRISGYVSTRTKSVGDMLNDRLKSYLDLEDVYISRISDPGDIVAAYAEARLRKENLLFAIVPSAESLSKATRSVSYFGRQHLPVWLSLPTIEISGDLLVVGISFDLETYLATSPGDYLTVLDGTARATFYPDVTFGGEAFLVNKGSIDLFCLGSDRSQ
jgi:hypothetical protein